MHCKHYFNLLLFQYNCIAWIFNLILLHFYFLLINVANVVKECKDNILSFTVICYFLECKNIYIHHFYIFSINTYNSPSKVLSERNLSMKSHIRSPVNSILYSASIVALCGACTTQIYAGLKNTKLACSSAKSQRHNAPRRGRWVNTTLPGIDFSTLSNPPVPRRPPRASVTSMHHPSYSWKRNPPPRSGFCCGEKCVLTI